MLNPYLEPQLKGYVLSHNSRNTSNPPLSNARRLVDHKFSIKSPSCSSTNRLAGDTCRQALPALRPPGGCHVPPGAQRLKILSRCRYRPVVLLSPPGANVAVAHCCTYFAWCQRPTARRYAIRLSLVPSLLPGGVVLSHQALYQNNSLSFSPAGAIPLVLLTCD